MHKIFVSKNRGNIFLSSFARETHMHLVTAVCVECSVRDGSLKGATAYLKCKVKFDSVRN